MSQKTYNEYKNLVLEGVKDIPKEKGEGVKAVFRLFNKKTKASLIIVNTENGDFKFYQEKNSNVGLDPKDLLWATSRIISNLN